MNHKEIDKSLFKERLRSCYFKFVSNLTTYSYEELLLGLTEKLNQIIDTVNVGIYVSNQWNQKYRLVCNNIEEIPNYLRNINEHIHLLQHHLSNQPFVNGKEIFKQQMPGLDSIILKLNANHQPFFLLLLSPSNHLSRQLITHIQDETNQLVEIIYYFYSNRDHDRKNKFLLDLSSHLCSTIDKKDILNKIIESLQILYPNFSYYLLLSYDFEADCDLPIKLIEYSDDVTKRLSTKAFTTGEVQIEVNDHEINLYAPLIGNQGVYGVIQIITQEGIHFSDEEIEFISQFSHIAGTAIEKATLYQNSIKLVSNLKLINDITHKLNSNLKFTQLIEIIRNEIIKSCEASQVGFVYYHEKTKSEFDILKGSTSYFNSSEGRIFVEHLARQIEKKKDPLFSGDYTKKYSEIPFKSVIAIPMIESGLAYGFIIVMHEKSSFFTFESFKFMQSLIHHSTLALTNAVLKDKLEKAVITDYLTKLFSRSHLDEMLKKHMETDERGTLILLDIDDFKGINDTYGHYIGDEVIIQIADIIKQNIDEDDIPTRWGGEEFAIYLPHKTRSVGVQLAEKIREQVIKKTEPQVTFSCGIATWDMSKTDSVSEIFIRADKALYEAKGMGKNCIVTEECMKIE